MSYAGIIHLREKVGSLALRPSSFSSIACWYYHMPKIAYREGVVVGGLLEVSKRHFRCQADARSLLFFQVHTSKEKTMDIMPGTIDALLLDLYLKTGKRWTHEEFARAEFGEVLDEAIDAGYVLRDTQDIRNSMSGAREIYKSIPMICLTASGSSRIRRLMGQE